MGKSLVSDFILPMLTCSETLRCRLRRCHNCSSESAKKVQFARNPFDIAFKFPTGPMMQALEFNDKSTSINT